MSTSSFSSLIQAHGRSRDASSNIKFGYITSYDPNNYAVRVRLEPESAANESRGINDSVVETNWIPIYRPYGGNTWGYKAPPNADPNPPYGDQCLVMFPDGGMGVAFIGSYNNVENPYQDRLIGDPLADNHTDPAPLAGEFQFVHNTGSFLKFRNDGTVMLFGKPKRTNGSFPGSPLLYLRGDNGQVELRDAHNNRLILFSTTDDFFRRIALQDAEGNLLVFFGNSNTKIGLLDTSNNQLTMGSNLGGGQMISLADGHNNRIEMYGTASSVRLKLASTDGHAFQFSSDGSVIIATPGASAEYRMTNSSISFGVGASRSQVVTLQHLAAVVAQINAFFATKGDNSGSPGNIFALASNTVQCSV